MVSDKLGAIHHEVMRERVVSIFLAISGFCIASAGWNKSFDVYDGLVGVFIFFIGAFGSIISLKHYQLFEFHYSRYRQYRNKINAENGEESLIDVLNRADENFEKELVLSGLKSVRLHFLWAMIPLVVSFLGLALAIIGFTA